MNSANGPASAEALTKIHPCHSSTPTRTSPSLTGSSAGSWSNRGAESSVPSSRLTRDIFFRFLRLRSGSEWEIPRQPTPLMADSIRANSATALGWLADGRLRVEPLITHRPSPTAIQEAYDGLLTRKDEYLGVVLRWS